MRLYTEVLRLAPDDAWAYDNRSEVYAALGDEETASRDRRQAERLGPSITVDGRDD